MTNDALTFLADSPVRSRVLGALQSLGPSRPSELRDELDVSRATVHRNLSALTDRGWVRQDDDGYHVTTAGVLVHGHFEHFQAGIETVDRFQALLEAVPPEGVPPLDVLANAELVTTTQDKPHAPVMRYVEELTASDTGHVHGLTPVRSDMFDLGHDQLLQAGVETELVLPRDVLEAERRDAGDEFGETLTTDGFSLFVLEDDPGFGLTVLDDSAFVGGYGPDNQLVALAYATDDSFVSWAADTFESTRSRAARVPGEQAEVDESTRPD
ncbi:helix-turn-helix domain-containing protein [Halorubellus sp. PRR65]|uniref:helix-turn-helix transcriptional regulator n=1 Tax=Halorubellus sp. PRR65 TaxID=3098148 RepID=UPI002B259B1D|nr:helix-turn-helix domain-containing protein [Halorubellus sp. PRR65]